MTSSAAGDRNTPPTPQPRPPFAGRSRSVRTQLVLWNVVTLSALLGALGIGLHFTVRSLMIAAVDKELIQRSRRPPPAAPRNPPPPREQALSRPDNRPPIDGPPQEQERPGPPGPDGPNEPRADVNGDGSEPHLELRPREFDLRGQPFDQNPLEEPWDRSSLEEAAHSGRTFTTVIVEGVPVRLISTPFPEGRTARGIRQVPFPLTELNHAVALLDAALLTLLPIALLLAGLGGWLLTDRMLRPVRRLSWAAGRVGASDLSERLPVTGQDEFSELSATFNGMMGRLEAAFKEQRRFTADASHELRTPLTIIKANTSLYRSGSLPREEFDQCVVDIDEAADRMSRLVQDLLLLARSEDSRLGRRRTELPLAELLRRSAAGFSRRGGAPITVSVAHEGVCLYGNEDELIRLFANLLENANKHTPEDGRIAVTANTSGRLAVVEVEDTGTGIASEHLAHLGERFYRVDSSRARTDGGTGLGLSICKEIVEAHGGTMSFESRTGIGTKVTVRLPKAV